MTKEEAWEAYTAGAERTTGKDLAKLGYDVLWDDFETWWMGRV